MISYPKSEEGFVSIAFVSIAFVSIAFEHFFGNAADYSDLKIG